MLHLDPNRALREALAEGRGKQSRGRSEQEDALTPE